jgi:hypothetical protein
MVLPRAAEGPHWDGWSEHERTIPLRQDPRFASNGWQVSSLQGQFNPVLKLSDPREVGRRDVDFRTNGTWIRENGTPN